MPQPKDLQMALLNQIIQRFPRKSDAVTKLEEVLFLKRDSVARRLRGETLLSPKEIQTLAIYFEISLDQLVFGATNKSFFTYNLYNQPINNFLDYLNQIYNAISAFNQWPNFEVRYASREIPLFIYMMFPKLLAFKLYVFGLTTWHFDYLQNRPFSFDLLIPKELELAEQITRLYCSIASRDYWTVTILEQSLNQIEYMALEGRIEDKETVSLLCAEVQRMVDHAHLMAEHGRKFLPGQTPSELDGQFDLYFNEIVDTNNMILAISDQQSGLFHTFDTPNFLFTADQRICKSVEDWFDKTLGNSTSISVHSGRNRNHYFKKLGDRIQKSTNHLGTILD